MSVAKRAYEGYLAALGPVVEPMAKSVSGSIVQRLLGFCLMWHIAGGLEELIETGWTSQASAYRQRTEFRRVFGCDVTEFLPKIAVAFRDLVDDLDHEPG